MAAPHRLPQRTGERGNLLVALLAVLVPTLLMVATMTQTMARRGAESGSAIAMQQALLAADAGIDEATFRGGQGTLADGVPFDVDIDGDGGTTTGPLRCTVTPTWLGGDGADNDGDAAVDEADEDVFQVIAVGSYQGAVRRVAAYLGPVPLLPAITAAVVVSDPAVGITLSGSSLITGTEVSLAGVPTGAAVPGLQMADPGTLAWLDGQLTGGERARVVGSGGAPSLGTTAAIDWASLVPQLQNVADVVLTGSSYSGLTVGSTSPWTAQIALRSGDVTIQGNSTGVGVLLVDGDLTVRGNFTWYGVVIVTGSVNNSSGSALIRGALLQGDAGGSFTGTGNLTIQYSGEAVALASSSSGRYTSFNGWQELARP